MKLFVSITFFVLAAFYGIEAAFLYVIDGRNYYISVPDKHNWFAAKEFCTFNGMYLIDIVTYFDHLRMLEMIDVAIEKHNITADQARFWTSGTSGYRPYRDQYYWATTGQMVFWDAWEDGFPELHEEAQFQENYSIAYIYSKWNNLKGKEVLYFICRDKIGPPAASLIFNKS